MNDKAGPRFLQELELDERLASEPQQAIRGIVSALDTDEVSLAWRSALNERLLETAARQRRQRVMGWVLKPAFGLAFAGALALVVVMRHPDNNRPSMNAREAGIESSIISAHRDSVSFSDMVGAGLLPVEVVNDKTTGTPARSDWSEVDVETL